MAFTWQVELYRKLIDDIVDKSKSKVDEEEEAVKNLPVDWEEKLLSMPTGTEEEFDAFAKAMRKTPTAALKQSTDELMAKQDKETEEFEREYGPLIPAGSELEKRMDAHSGKSSGGFTWEVEALRKLIEGIVEEVEIKQAGDELAQEHIDAYKKKPEASQLWDVYKEEWVPNPGARVDPNDPFGLNDPDPVEGISYEEFYESLRDEEEAELDRDLAPFKRLYQQGKREAGRKVREEGDKLKLDWVNEILQELPEDKTPEVIRLPQWTTPVPDHLKSEEGKPDVTPFLSYLLRQSPYARLPAAGLLGLGLMGYSQPAY